LAINWLCHVEDQESFNEAGRVSQRVCALVSKDQWTHPSSSTLFPSSDYHSNDSSPSPRTWIEVCPGGEWRQSELCCDSSCSHVLTSVWRRCGRSMPGMQPFLLFTSWSGLFWLKCQILYLYSPFEVHNHFEFCSSCQEIARLNLLPETCSTWHFSCFQFLVYNEGSKMLG